MSATGVTGTGLARRYKVPVSATNLAAVLADPQIRGVIVTTRHNLHAAMTIAALRAGKHVLVEKPLCLKVDELRELETCVASPPVGGPTVTVGFNRRFFFGHFG